MSESPNPCTGPIQMKYWAIVPAAGTGKRMGKDAVLPKQYLHLKDKTLLEHSLSRLDSLEILSGIVLVLDKEDEYFQEISLQLSSPRFTVNGGLERVHSVFNGLAALEDKGADDDWVLVHDAVRPCVRIEDMQKLIRELKGSDSGGILAMPVNDTLKKAGSDQTVDVTLDRKNLWRAATPQMFKLGKLHKALARVIDDNEPVTDEAQAMELSGQEVQLVECSSDNIKITRPADLTIAAEILRMQE